MIHSLVNVQKYSKTVLKKNIAIMIYVNKDSYLYP